MRELNKKVLVMIVAFFAVVISASSIAPILASETYTEIVAGGQSNVLEVPGQPKFGVLVQTFYRSSDHGARDRIWISIFNPLNESQFMPVAVLSDGSNEPFPDVWAGLPVAGVFRTVKPWTIQVSRIGKLVIAYWTKPIECVVPPPLNLAYGIDSWTLPPGMLILKGYGEVDTTPIGPYTLPSGCTVSNEPNTYAAKGTFFCPSWRFCCPVSEKATISTHTVVTLEFP